MPTAKKVSKRSKPYRDTEAIKRFGKRLREIRLSKGISQEDLVRLSGFDLSQIGRIERGAINTSISHVFKLSECLNVPAYQFFIFKDIDS